MARLPSLKRDPDSLGFLADEFDALCSANSQRIERYKEYRREGMEVRDLQVYNRIGAPPEVRDYGRGRRSSEFHKHRHHIPLPLAKALNVKHSYRIAGRLPDVIVDTRDESPEERYRSETMEKIVWAIFRASRAETQFSAGAWDGSELGSACFDLYFSIDKQMPVFRSVDPAGIVEVQGVSDPHQFQRIYRFWDVPLVSLQAQYRDEQFRGQPVRVGDIGATHDHAGVAMVKVASCCDKTQQTVFIPSQNIGLSEYVHNYGFVPYIVIPNIGPEREVWGWADYEFIRPLVAYITALFGREADLLRAVANGSYLEKGTGQTPESVQATLGVGGVIPSKKDGSIDPIGTPQAPAFEEAHAARAMELFKMLGFAPDASWGQGGAPSAADRGLMLQPLVEYTASKQLNWEAGLGRMFAMAYQMIEGKMAGKAVYRGSVQNKYGGKRQPFSFEMGPGMPAADVPNPDSTGGLDSEGDPGAGFDGTDFISLPQDPKQLFDGDYDVRFSWNNRIDADDPSYALAEVNKFTSGVQSLETTLERLGVESPEDEMRRMENEADRFPWINQGLIKLITAQIAQSGAAQGQGGGNPGGDQQQQAMDAASTSASDQSGSLNADAANQGIGPGVSGFQYGGAGQ